MTTALVPFNHDRYLARKKVFSFLGQAFHIYDAQGNLCFYVKQKAFKLKEAITVFADEGKTQPLLTIQARSVLDFGATYDVATVEGEALGALRRRGFKSMLRDQWEILDTSDEVVGTIEEDSMALALVRRLLSNLVPQGFTVELLGNTVATFQQRFNPFIAKIELDFSMDTAGELDRRLGIAAVVLLMAIEGRQQ